ncbi:MAG: hypothetical protein HXS48_16615 [Theionarchaea archaeon]|nr:MAG: hypothetical protein AYK19_06470 [Theionarchaea archaeon DG-70-1]MBU7028559.1 hypothetical protein [Theionarchaea archaeon]
MRFVWSQYLTLAKELAGHSVTASTEAKLRSSVSRAYYAAFCEARNYLRNELGYPIPTTGEAHKLVIDNLKTSIEPKLRRVGINLDRLRIDRNKTDYKDSVTGLHSMTKMALMLSEQIISTLNTS